MRPEDSGARRGFALAWASRALWEYNGDLADLNAQLALRPDPEHPFKAGVWPRPYYPREAADRFFDGALAGRSPDCWEWVNREAPGTCFNLFLRVALHLPGSEDWLFRGLTPYVRSSPPAIDVALELLDECLKRLGLRVLSERALSTVLSLEPDRGRQIAQQGIDRLIGAGEPIHLVTLFALWHVAHWQRPFSAHAEELHLAARLALNRFVNRPEFELNELTNIGRKCVFESLNAVRRNIKENGFRVPYPTKPWPEIGLLPILVKDFENRDEAIDCASIGTDVPVELVLNPEPALFRQDGIPSTSELQIVTRLLLKAAELSSEDLSVFSRDPQVLAELGEPQQRTVTPKRKRRA